MILKNNKVYDVLKFISMIGLPAFAAFYLGMAQLWNWEHTDQIVGSLALLSTFLGAVLQISAAKYNNSAASHDGYVATTGADEDTGNPDVKIVFNKLPNELMDKKTVRLKVGHPPVPKEELEGL
jgi:hypothetical protein